MPDFLVLLDWIAALLFAGAIGMTALSSKEIRVASIVVWLAAAIFALRWIMWGFTTEQSHVVRILIGAVAGGFLVGVLPPVLTWMTEKGFAKQGVLEEKTKAYLECNIARWPESPSRLDKHHDSVYLIQPNSSGRYNMTREINTGDLGLLKEKGASSALMECKLSFYPDSLPIFNIEAEFIANIYVNTSSGSSGNLIDQVNGSITIGRIDAEQREVFFYVYSFNANIWFNVSELRSFTYTDLGSAQPLEAKVAISSKGKMLMVGP